MPSLPARTVKILPLIVFLSIIPLTFLTELSIIAREGNPWRCNSSATSEFKDVASSPSISIHNVANFDTALHPNQSVTVHAAPGNVQLAPETFKLYVDVGGDDTVYTIHDEEIDVAETLNGYAFTFTPSIPYRDQWSVFFFASVCDLAGHGALSAKATSVCDDDPFCVFNTYPAYLIQYFVWFFAIFGPIVVRRPWGVVFDSATRLPIARAIVRLYSNGILADTAVTDGMGTFRLKPPRGTYRVQVTSAGYTFPSTVRALGSLGPFGNLYYGEKIEINDDSSHIFVNIPMDPSNRYGGVALRQLASEVNALFYQMNSVVLVSAAALILVVYGIALESFLLTLLNGSLLAMKYYLSRRNRNPWGMVSDETGKPVPNLEIQLRETLYDHLIATETTNDSGRFQFVVPGGMYRLKVVSNTYVFDTSKKQAIEFAKRSRTNVVIVSNLHVRKVHR